MPDQVDTTKIIDLGNLKYYHSRLSVNYLEPLNERVTSFATSSEIDEYLFNITSVSVEEPISNDYAITGMGLNAFIDDNDSSDESLDAYDYPKVLSINVAPGTCTINDTLYNVPFTVLKHGLRSSGDEPWQETIYSSYTGGNSISQPSSPGKVTLAIRSSGNIPVGTDLISITGIWETNSVSSHKTVTITSTENMEAGTVYWCDADSSEELVSVDNNGIDLLTDIGSGGLFAILVTITPAASSGSPILTVIATEQDNDAILSLEEGEVSSDNLQSNQVLIGTVTYSDSGISGISPTPSGTNTIISAPTIETDDGFEVSLSDGVISIQGKCYRIANNVANGYTFEDLDDVASSCGTSDYDGHLDEPVAYLSPVIPESSESSEIDSLIPYEAYHDESSAEDASCRIQNEYGYLDTRCIDEENYDTDSPLNFTRLFPIKLTLGIKTEGVLLSTIPANTNIVGITAYWMSSNGSFAREKRWVQNTSAISAEAEVSIEVNTPVAMIEKIELNEDTLGQYIDTSDEENYITSRIACTLDYVAVPQYIVACVRNNRLAIKYMTYTSDSPTLATDEIILGKVVYSYNSSSGEAEATIIPASEL